MFENSLVESSAVLRTGNRWPAIISTAFYTMLALALVSLPMLHPEVLTSLAHPLIALTLPRPATPPPPPPRVRMLPNATSATSTPVPPMPPTTTLITHTPVSQAEPATPPDFSSTTSMNTPSMPTLLSNSIPSGPVVHVSTATNGKGPDGTAAHGRLTVSTGVSQGLLLTPLHPVFPPIARAAHQEGTVIVQAIITRTGLIESAHVVSGPAMLQGSALDAVRSARYRPYLLNGQPTEVDTTFSINFVLGSSY